MSSAARTSSNRLSSWLRALLALLLAAACAAPALAAGRLVAGTNEPAPPLSLRDLDGNEVRLEAFRGRTVVVNFWATWCAPCVAEMPSLARLRAALAPAGVEVLAVNLQENAARIRPFAERLGLQFPIVRDHDGSVTRAWGARVFPTTYVVGPDQRIALVAVGDIEWDAPDVLSRVREVARRPGAAPPGARAETFPTPFPRSSLWIAALS
jgi:peroxiredoxin